VRVLISFTDHRVTFEWLLCLRRQWSLDLDNDVSLNPRQKEAVIAITAEGCEIPPILVIGNLLNKSIS
jgi:hypothetical protein